MDKRLTGRKVLVFAEDMYEDLELWYPVLRLREEGAEVTIAGTGAEEYTGKNGHPVKVDTEVDQVQTGTFDALVIPGGYAPDKLRRSPSVLEITREMALDGKVVAAVCHAPWVLVSVGLLEGRRTICFPSLKDDVINAGAQYEDAEVVRDGNFITSRQPSDLGAFCREIIQALVVND
jgi:protease I